jgi:hypothetical protein
MCKVRWQINRGVISTTDKTRLVTDKIVVGDVIFK